MPYWFMSHYVTSCSSHPFKGQRQTGTSCTAMVCDLIQLHEATLFIQCHVLCVEHHSDTTVKAFTMQWFENWCSIPLSLAHMTTKLCPWCWRENKTNTTSSFLSIARFVPECVSVWSILIIDHITQVILHRNGTLMTLQQQTAIFREILKLCWETLKGNLKRDEAGWQPLLLLVSNLVLLHCAASIIIWSLTSSPNLWV